MPTKNTRLPPPSPRNPKKKGKGKNHRGAPSVASQPARPANRPHAPAPQSAPSEGAAQSLQDTPPDSMVDVRFSAVDHCQIASQSADKAGNQSSAVLVAGNQSSGVLVDSNQSGAALSDANQSSAVMVNRNQSSALISESNQSSAIMVDNQSSTNPSSALLVDDQQSSAVLMDSASSASGVMPICRKNVQSCDTKPCADNTASKKTKLVTCTMSSLPVVHALASGVSPCASIQSTSGKLENGPDELKNVSIP